MMANLRDGYHMFAQTVSRLLHTSSQLNEIDCSQRAYQATLSLPTETD